MIGEWAVIQRYDGRWQIVCPVCGNRGGNYLTKSQAEEIAKLSAELHTATNHK